MMSPSPPYPTTYAEDMRHGAILPAIDVYEKDTGGDIHYLLVDGRHRLEAAKRIDATRIFARVYQGNRRDALIHAAGANSKNGLRRTNADKQKTVKMLLGDEELVQWSDTYMLLERRHNPSVRRLPSGFQALRHRLEPVVSQL